MMLAACASALIVGSLDTSPFSDDFSYADGTLLNSLPAWIASPTGLLGAPPQAQSQNAVFFGAYANPLGLHEAYAIPSLNDVACSWPIERIYDDFVTLTMDVAFRRTAQTVTFGDDLLFSALFAPNSSVAGFDDTPGPAIAAEFWVNTQKRDSAIRIRAKLSDNSLAFDETYDLGSIGFEGGQFDYTDSVFRTFRIDLGWDLRTVGTASADAIPEDVLAIRPRVWNPANSTWEDPSPDSNGSWIWLEPMTIDDWTGGGATGSTFVSFYQEQLFASPTSDTLVDNLSIDAHLIAGFALLHNTIGYDTKGPQYAFIRANHPDYNVPNLLDLGASALEMVLQDGTRIPATISQSEESFSQIDRITYDYDDDPSNDNPVPITWWPVSWSPVSTDTTAHVEGQLVTTTGETHDIYSESFSIASDLLFPRLFSGVALLNEKFRRADRDWADPECDCPTLGPEPPQNQKDAGGWFDANGRNSENRAHGNFLTGLASLLEHRRFQLSTEDTRQLVSALLYGADYVQRLESLDESYQGSHGTPQDNCKGATCSHPLAPGHIWWVDASRGSSGDDKNSAPFIFDSLIGLLDTAIALGPVPGHAALSSSYHDTARDSYMYLQDTSLVGVDCELEPRVASVFLSRAHLLAPFYDSASQTLRMLDDDILNFPPEVRIGPGTFAHNVLNWVLDGRACGNPPRHFLDSIAHAASAIGSHPEIIFLEDTSDAVRNHWYEMQLDPAENNTLRTVRWWKEIDTTHLDFFGRASFTNKDVSKEAFGLAASDVRQSDVDLTSMLVGNLFWLLGIHVGVEGMSTIAPGRDELHTSASLLINEGSVSVLQSEGLGDLWCHPTLVNGFAAGNRRRDMSQGADPGFGWQMSPDAWSSTETFIVADGYFLLALNAYDQILRPWITINAEDYVLSDPGIRTDTNGTLSHPNTGLSITSDAVGDTADLLVSTTPDVSGTLDLTCRVSNASSTTPGQVGLTIIHEATGSLVTSTNISVDPTGHEHEYILTQSFSVPFSMQPGEEYRIILQFDTLDVWVDSVTLRVQ